MFYEYIVDELPDLIAKYSEPHRKYHNLTHIARMFDIAHNCDIPLSREQMMAIWYHDYVYDLPKGEKSNEVQSAEIAFEKCKELGFGLGAGIVRQMILDTELELPTLTESKVIIDLDLWDLSSVNKFEANDKLLEEEFIPVFGKKQYIFNRINWIESFLARDSIYVSKYANLDMERDARYNLKTKFKELNRITF